MLACPRSGFAMLSMPKTASTAVVSAVRPHADVALSGTPRLKHVGCRAFHQHVAPLLEYGGYPRDSYELVSMFREPVQWLESWWRYRSHPRLRRRPEKYAGDLTFDEYAVRYLHGTQGSRGRPARFVSMGPRMRLGVDRLFQFERPDVWQGWLSERIGEPLDFPRVKVMGELERRTGDLTPATRRALEEHFAPEYDIYRHLVANGGQWAPPRGYRPGR